MMWRLIVCRLGYINANDGSASTILVLKATPEPFCIEQRCNCYSMYQSIINPGTAFRMPSGQYSPQINMFEGEVCPLYQI
jgi:hypothetical protein